MKSHIYVSKYPFCSASGLKKPLPQYLSKIENFIIFFIGEILNDDFLSTLYTLFFADKK